MGAEAGSRRGWRERAGIADVAEGEVAANGEDGAAGAVDVGEVPEIVGAEIAAVASPVEFFAS